MFGDNLKAAREAKGLTQDRLVEIYRDKFAESGLNKGTLSKYENGKQEPIVSTVNNLADILGVSVDYLLGKEKINSVDLNNMEEVYLDFAKDAQKNSIDPDDIRDAINMIKRLRNKQ